VFYLLWIKQVHINTQIVTEQTLKLNESELQVRELVGEIRIIKERRELRDSLLLINQKKRQDEKIKLLESANDSTISAIIRGYINGSK
jgi:hypothetical protein